MKRTEFKGRENVRLAGAAHHHLQSQGPCRTEYVLAWGRENAFAKRVIITLAVIHLSGFPGVVFYYDFSALSLVLSQLWARAAFLGYWAVPSAQTAHSPRPGGLCRPPPTSQHWALQPQPLPCRPRCANPRAPEVGLGLESVHIPGRTASPPPSWFPEPAEAQGGAGVLRWSGPLPGSWPCRPPRQAMTSRVDPIVPQEDEALRKETTCKKGLQENQASEMCLLGKNTNDI